jgi:hypothetical protein
MPDVDSHLFSVALNVFLFFGAAHLSTEQLISLVVLYKKLRAILRSHYSLELGKLEVDSSLEPDESTKMDASLVAQVMALSPADRQVLSSLLEILSLDGLHSSGAAGKAVTQRSTSGHDEDLGSLDLSAKRSKPNLTH